MIIPIYYHPIPDPIDPYVPSGPEDPAVQRKDTLSTHLMTGVDKLHAAGLLGQGIKIGIIDSGIDYTHPALGGKFGPGNKVIGGYDFVGDAYTGSSGPAPVPDDDVSSVLVPLNCTENVIGSPWINAMVTELTSRGSLVQIQLTLITSRVLRTNPA